MHKHITKTVHLQFIIIAFLVFNIKCSTKENDDQDELLSVILIHRHGDRTPMFSYPNDPYKDDKFWPVGPGQLTNEGKKRMHNLGKYLRNRYKNHLPDTYSEKDIHISSTDTDRTLMSASLVLSGLYPPSEKQIWNSDLLWQPIPIHTAPTPLFNKLHPGCPKYNHLWKNVLKSEQFKAAHSENVEMFEYLSKHSGKNISSIFHALALRDVLYIESLFNYTLPDWTLEVFPDKLDKLLGLGYLSFGYNDDLLRLATGPFFNNLIGHFENSTNAKRNKNLMFSGHDTNIGSILAAVGAYDYQEILYGSALIFELKQRKNEAKKYVNLFYKRDGEAEQIHLAGCNFDCDFDTFKSILGRIVITSEQWENDCFSGDFKETKFEF